MARTIYKTQHTIPLYKHKGEYITEWEATMLAEKGAAIVEESDSPYTYNYTGDTSDDMLPT